VTSRFDDKNVVITGGVGGIGQALVELFASEGANVLFSDRSEEDCNDFSESLKRKGMDTHYLAGDLRQKTYCEALIAESVVTFGGVDILINNAGIIPRGNILETTDDMWFSALDVNLNAVFFLCRAARRLLHQQGGGGRADQKSRPRPCARRHPHQRGLPQRGQHADAAQWFHPPRHRSGQRDRGTRQERAAGARRRTR
jgi:NAD(P)-dependent dehydrogenase (short-subunit alcohol dehydrogenase family)